MSDPRRVLFVLGSTRVGGNSETLARVAAQALASEGVASTAECTCRWLRLLDLALPPFYDTRHTTGYEPPREGAAIACEATLWATDLVIVSGVNWYSLAWPAKLYLDHYSAWMRVPELAFRERMAGKRLYGVIVDSERPDEAGGSADPVIDTLRRTAEHLHMDWRGVLLGHANRPGEVMNDARALAAAAGFFGLGAVSR